MSKGKNCKWWILCMSGVILTCCVDLCVVNSHLHGMMRVRERSSNYSLVKDIKCTCKLCKVWLYWCVLRCFQVSDIKRQIAVPMHVLEWCILSHYVMYKILAHLDVSSVFTQISRTTFLFWDIKNIAKMRQKRLHVGTISSDVAYILSLIRHCFYITRKKLGTALVRGDTSSSACICI